MSRREHSLEGIERTIIRFNEFFLLKLPKNPYIFNYSF